MNGKNACLFEQLSSHLFWDVEYADIDAQRHARFVIGKVLIYGLYSDWKVLLSYYGLETIIGHAQKMRELDKRTASFLSVISGVPKSEFICYTTKPFQLKHWNF